jgi:nucleoid-associated protein YgaU
VLPREAAASPRLRLTARGRAAVATCAVVVATLLWFAVATAAHASAHGAPAAPAQQALTQVVVQPGQTLWSIATQADPSADPRLVVQRIVTANKLTSESVAAGQRLRVPRG